MLHCYNPIRQSKNTCTWSHLIQLNWWVMSRVTRSWSPARNKFNMDDFNSDACAYVNIYYMYQLVSLICDMYLLFDTSWTIFDRFIFFHLTIQWSWWGYLYDNESFLDLFAWLFLYFCQSVGRWHEIGFVNYCYVSCVISDRWFCFSVLWIELFTRCVRRTCAIYFEYDVLYG